MSKHLFIACVLAASGAWALDLPNSSFTTEGTGGLPQHWNLSHDGAPSNVTAARDVSEFKTAPAALRVQSGPSGHTEGFVYCNMPLAPIYNKAITVTGWGKATGGVLSVVVHTFEPGYEVNHWNHLGVIDTPEWTEWSFTFQFPAPPLALATCNLFLSSPGTTAWIDDVKVLFEGETAVRLDALRHSTAAPGASSVPLRVLGLDGRSVTAAADLFDVRCANRMLLMQRTDQSAVSVIRLQGN